MTRPASLELLESRIAPALVVVNPLANILVGAGHAGKTIELSQMFDSQITNAGHTIVTFTLNLDSNPSTTAIEPTTFRMELFDDEAPLTVQNFLRYIESPTGSAEFLNTFFHRSVSDFVVQGGGFSTSDLAHHIGVFAEVHNEFSAERSNLRGTIAMAKTEVSPNSATSEWFVNLSDNSSNLDNQNGGFTVFGKIFDADMPVFDTIAALPTTSLSSVNGALTNVPVQKLSTGATPGPDNFIRITDLHVETPQKGSTTGVTYTASSSDGHLVTTKIVGSTLQLTYNGKATGIATITVNATDGTDTITPQTFTVSLTPNLITSVSKDALQTLLVPGDTGKATLAVQNTGGGAFSGLLNIKFYLSKTGTATDPNGVVVEPDQDLLIGSVLNQSLTLAAGKTVRLTQGLNIDPSLIEGDPSIYRVLIDVEPVSGATSELFTDDNSTLNGGLHAILNQFGSISFQGVSRSGVKIKYHDPVSDELVTLGFKGSGSGTITLDNGLADLSVSGTNASTQLKLTTSTATGRANFDQFDVASTIGKIDFHAANISGPMAFSGGAKTILLGDITGDHLLSIGAFPPINTQKVSITFGTVKDLSIESSQPIGTLKAIEWKDTTGANDSLTAYSISTLKIVGSKSPSVAGDFEANVTTYSEKTLSTISVAGVVRNAAIKTVGSIGNVTVGGMEHSSLFAGVSERPDSLSDFAQPRTISSFTVRAIEGVTDQFIDSQVAAATISKIVVRGVVGANGGTAFGFVADKVGSYSRIGGPKFSSKLDTAQTADQLGDFQLVIL